MDKLTVWKNVLRTVDNDTQSALNDYLTNEINKAVDRLVSSNDPDEVRMLQGAIRSFKSLLNLRNKAERVLVNGSG